jgi:type IV secretory pathway TraG/TraD family ATPase VirD4
MTIIEFFKALLFEHYLIMWISLLVFSFFFYLSKNYLIASLALANYFGFLWLFFEFGFSLSYYLYMILPSWGVAFGLNFFLAQDTSPSTIQRAILKANKKSIIENVFEGILVTGAAGSGKTQSVIYQILQHYAKYNFSGIIYDYKDFELTELAYPIFKKTNLNFACFCLHDPARSIQINPIAPRYIENEDDLMDFFEVLYDNIIGNKQKDHPFFRSATLSAVSALAWKLKEDDPLHCNLPFLVALFSQKTTKEISELISSNLRARTLGNIFIDALNSIETSTNIKASIGAFLRFFLSPEKFFCLSKDKLSLEINNPSSPTVLCFINKPSQQKAYAPILSALVGVTLKQISKKEKNPSFLLLDEAPTLKLQDISRIPATMRSYNISTLYCMQDKSLSDEIQGDMTTRAILSNLSSLYIGKANDESTARMYQELSSLIKEKQISYNQASNWISAKGENRINTSIREKTSMHKSEFFKFKSGEFYNFSNGFEQKLKFPYKEPSKNKPPIIHVIEKKEIENYYIEMLQKAKDYPLEEKQNELSKFNK